MESSNAFRKHIKILSKKSAVCFKLFDRYCVKELLTTTEWRSLLQLSSHALLIPDLTELLGTHLRPWLPELLPLLASHEHLQTGKGEKRRSQKNEETPGKKYKKQDENQFVAKKSKKQEEQELDGFVCNKSEKDEKADKIISESEKQSCDQINEKIKPSKRSRENTDEYCIGDDAESRMFCADIQDESDGTKYSADYMKMHRAVCVCLARLMPISPDAVLQFVLEYFDKNPAPFVSNCVDESTREPQSKKQKRTDLPPLQLTSDLDVLQATYQLVLSAGRQLATVCLWTPPITHTTHHLPEVRWLACQSISSLTCMTENQRRMLVLQHVTAEQDAQFCVKHTQWRQPMDMPGVWQHLHADIKGAKDRKQNLAQKENMPLLHEGDKNKLKGNKGKKGVEVSEEGMAIEEDDLKGNTKHCLVMPLKYTNFVGNNLLPNCEGRIKRKKTSTGITLHPTASTLYNLHRVWCGVASRRPVLLEGAVGCGKTATVEYLAALTGRHTAPGLTKVQLGEQTDGRSLLGIHRCTATPGEFVWSPGAITRALTEGHWLLLEDVDAAQTDVVAVLAGLLEDGELVVPGCGVVRAHRDFRVFATRRLSCDGRRVLGGTMGAAARLEALWYKVPLQRLSKQEMIQVVTNRCPRLEKIAERLVTIYMTLTPGQHPEEPNSFNNDQSDDSDSMYKPKSGYIIGGKPSKADSRKMINDPTVSSSSNNTGTLVSSTSGSVISSGTVSATSASGRLVSFRDLLKWADRIQLYTELDGAVLPVRAFQEALDCFCAAVPNKETRNVFAEEIASYLSLNKSIATLYCNDYKPEVSMSPQFIRIGERAKLSIVPAPLPSLCRSHVAHQTPFSFTRKSCVLLERIAVAVRNKEPVLIVGETGTGKTTAVSYLAKQTNRKLKVINLNQQSDAADLLGGFKPVEMKTILFPLREDFEELIAATFLDTAKVLRNIMLLYGSRNWVKFIDLLLAAQQMAVTKLDKELDKLKKEISEVDSVVAKKSKPLNKLAKSDENDVKPTKYDVLIQKQKVKLSIFGKWKKLRIKLEQAKSHVEKSQSALAFSFIEGALSKAISDGDWVLLDEINLANTETLECLASLLESQSGSLTLLERGDDRPIKRHPDFRLFACMNPATDTGKRELPPGLRNRFTEMFMDDLTRNDDLEILIGDYLKEHHPEPSLVQGVRKFYSAARQLAGSKGELMDRKLAKTAFLTDPTLAAPNYTLRTLCRALAVAAANQAGSFTRSLYEGFCLSFLTQLNRASHPIVENLILRYLILPKKCRGTEVSKSVYLNVKATLSKVLPHPEGVMDTVDGRDVCRVPEGTVVGNWVMVTGYWLRRGTEEPFTNDKYILTDSVKNNLRCVVRVVTLGGGSPVLLQGDTSVGKTSLIVYLAQKAGISCIRINNHEHTDIQEYLGCYSPDEKGKLVFREGALVTAMRRGSWIILDELNLAPTDVLEALNRLLDDNRELYLPETQETVRAHRDFRLFATQNPPGLYGGRKVLSRAFRNRFVELHFDEIPGNELIQIIHKRCSLSNQHSCKLVAVLQGLQCRRGRDNLFQGRQSLVTLRDLFRWAERYHLAEKPNTGKFYDWEQHLADEGYLLLAGRVRLEEEVQIIKQVIEEKLRCKIDPQKLFTLSENTSMVTRPILEKIKKVKGFEHLVFTEDMRRLYVTLSKSLSFEEPVLLVGETGCGKTTVCQMIAAQNEQELYSINCHMHTEGADFLGGLRPVRNRESIEDDRLFEWVDGPLVLSMKSGGMFLVDEISLADDSVLERLNSVLEPERTLVLAEKGSDAVGEVLETEIIVAHNKFRLIGTMNPGGDYGKKELSPAMRNRFTEIWCPKIEIGRASSDVLNIVEHNVSPGLFLNPRNHDNSGIGAAMLEFLQLFQTSELGRKCTISIRDIMSWVQFINRVTAEKGGNLDVGIAYIHGACLILLDGLGSGLTGTGLVGWQDLKNVSMNALYQQVWKLSSKKPDRSTLEEEFILSMKFVDESERFGIHPFIISKGKKGLLPDKMFTFTAPRTCINLVRVLRGLQLERPLLLEGSPGVGKTSLVVALAKATNNDFVRINLSEQTDVSDLFGADLPVEGAAGGKFAWRDGPLLQALRNGSWIILDELNLASQSVLEGLNACFDHRGEVFVPELGQTFKVSHKETKIFACQNPQHQGGARKGLPRSFLNRFTQVHIEPLACGDLKFILKTVYGEKIPAETISKMVAFNEKLVRAEESGEWGLVGGPWELNLRDLNRWCDLIILYSKPNQPPPHGQFVELLYASRLRTEADRQFVYQCFRELFGYDEGHSLMNPFMEADDQSGENGEQNGRQSGECGDGQKREDGCPDETVTGTDDGVQICVEPLFHITEEDVQIGNVSIDRLQSGEECTREPRPLCILQQQLPSLQRLMMCVSMRWLAILVGGAASGKTSLVHLLAGLAGRRVHTVVLTPQMDVSELIGGFQQVDHGRRLGVIVAEVGEAVTECIKHELLREAQQEGGLLLPEEEIQQDGETQQWAQRRTVRCPYNPTDVGPMKARQLLQAWEELGVRRKEHVSVERSSSEQVAAFLEQCDRLQHLLGRVCQTVGTNADNSNDEENNSAVCHIEDNYSTNQHNGDDTMDQDNETSNSQSSTNACMNQDDFDSTKRLGTRCMALLKEVTWLAKTVKENSSTAAGGIFEWVDSPLVVAVRTGQWLLVEGASLCPASLLDRLNPLLEPNGRLLLTERGVLAEGVPCVEPHPDFRMFLTVDPHYGNVSRAMRNRGVELFLKPLQHTATSGSLAATTADVDVTSDNSDNSDFDSDDEDVVDSATDARLDVTSVQLDCSGRWDVAGLLVAAGVGCARLQNALLYAHQRVAEVMPAYQQPGLSHLMGAARHAAQLLQCGDSEDEALRRALTQGYCRSHRILSMQWQIEKAIDESLKEVLEKYDGSAAAWPQISSLILQTPIILQQGANCAIVQQMVAYIECLLESQNDPLSGEEWMKAPLGPPEQFPQLEAAHSEVLTIIVTSLSPAQWPMFFHACERAVKEIPGGREVIGCLKRVLAEGKVWQGLPCLSKGSPADPRFNMAALRLNNKEELNCVVRYSNKVCLKVWRILQKNTARLRTVEVAAGKVSMQKKAIDGFSLMEISKSISEKKLSKNIAQHPCVPHLYPLIVNLDKFITNVTAVDDTELTDVEWAKIVATLRWRDRLDKICSKSIPKHSFHIFLPKLVLHWRFLQEHLLENVSESWSTYYPKLGKIVDKLSKIFDSNCGPIHDIAAELSMTMQHPKPCSTKDEAEVLTEMQRISTKLKPNLVQMEHNTFLASEYCYKARHQLARIASGFQKKRRHVACKSEIAELEESIDVAMEASTVKAGGVYSKVDTLKIQAWPIIDYIIAHQIQFCNFVKHREHLLDLVSLSVSMPLDIFESGPGTKPWVSCHLSSLLHATTATRNPQEWISYPKCLKRDDDDTEELKIVSKVYSPVQCLLTYLLSSGTGSEALQELKVGIHTEKEKQLTEIRATLWANWPTLSDPQLSPKSMFVKSVNTFITELLHSLSEAANVDTNSAALISDKVDLLTAILGEKVGSDACLLFDQIAKTWNLVLSSPDSSDTVQSAAMVGIAAGTLQAWLIGHMEPMDPTEKRKVLLHYKREEVEKTKQEILQHSWINILRGGKPLTGNDSSTPKTGSAHPHLTIQKEQFKISSGEISSLKREVAFRPEESQYIKLTQDVGHFIKTAFNPSVIQELTKGLIDESVTLNTTQQVDRKLITFDNFFNHVYNQFPLFRDVTSIFLSGLTMAIRSLRVLNADTKIRLANKMCGSDVTELLTNLSAFPFIRDPLNPLAYVSRIKNDVDSLTNIMGGEKTVKHCQSLALRTSLLEVYSAATIAGRLDDTTSTLLQNLVATALKWWRKQEEERLQKEEEDASLFRYKAREHAKTETEEETIEREFAEQFPNYEHDFDDLELPTLEKREEIEEKENKDDAADDWLTQQQLWEISEVHCNLLSKLPYSPLQDATKVYAANSIMKYGPIPAALQRVRIVQNVMNFTGPIAGCELDRTTMGAHLIFNYTACKSLNHPQSFEILQKPENFYIDPRPSEATKLRPLLLSLLNRIDELLEQWPEHPTLQIISRVVLRVLDFPITCPLAKLLTGVESILMKSEIWEKNAHRGVSLDAYLSPLKRQLVDWRKTELTEWKKCLDLVTYTEAVASRMKWWPHLYDCLATDVWEKSEVATLAVVLKDLMEEAALGDFETKLMLIFAFYRHLVVSKCEVGSVLHLTNNMYHYYLQFLPIIKEKLKSQRNLIETEVKEIVKIANYSIATFRDINQVREKVAKCCKSLHSSMRKWKRTLMSKEKEIWNNTATQELSPAHPAGLWDAVPKVPATVAVVDPATVMHIENINCGKVDSALRCIAEYSAKAHTLVVKTQDAFPYSECVEAIEDVTENVIESYHRFTLEAAKCSGESDKDVRMKKLKNVMKMRRSGVTHLFQQLYEMGIRYTIGNIDWTDDKFNECFQLTTFDIEALHLDARVLANLTIVWPGCDKYFYRSIHRFKLLHERLSAPHADLNPVLVKKIRGMTRHLLLISKTIRQDTSRLAINLHRLRLLVTDIQVAPSTPVAAASTVSSVWDKLHTFSLSLAFSVTEVRAVISTRPDTDTLVPLSTGNPEATVVSLMESDRLLQTIEVDCEKLAQRTSQLSAAFKNVNSRIINENHIELAREANQQLCVIAETVTKAVQSVDPRQEGHSCLTRELVSWLHKWGSVSTEINILLSNPAASIQPTPEINSNMNELENCVNSVCFAIQCLYKKYDEINVDEDPIGAVITETTVKSIISDIQSLRINYIVRCVENLVAEVSKGSNCELQHALCQVSSLLSQYLSLGECLLLQGSSSSRSIGKLTSVLLAVFKEMADNGFCKPKELEQEEGGKGKITYEDDDEAAGLDDGEGKEDMSDKLESEDQLEDALQQGEKEKPGDKDLEEDDGVEMSTDFEGKLQDVDKQDDEDGEADDKQDPEDQMGETESGAETLDKKLWNDKEEDSKENENGEMEKDENAQVNEEEMESQIVAKENDKKEKRNKKGDADDKKDKPEEMEEDTRQPNKPTEDDGYDDEFTDKYAGEQEEKDHEEVEQFDIPDELNMEEAEEEHPDKDEKDGDDEENENPLDIEEKSLFPEGKDLEEKENLEEEAEEKGKMEDDLPEEEGNEEGDGENNLDDMEGTDKDLNAEEVEDDQKKENEKEYKRSGIDEGSDGEKDKAEEEEDQEQKKTDDDVEGSKDKEAKNQAEAADLDAKDASKDKTKQAPKTNDEGNQFEEEEQQEERGEEGEATKESVGVGEAETVPQDDQMHAGEESAVTRRTDDAAPQQQENAMQQRRKPGEIDENKQTGNPADEEIRSGLMARRRTERKDEEQGHQQEDEEEQEEQEQRESTMWQVVKQAEAHHDGQVVDAGTREQAVEAPAPRQEDDAEEAQEEGVVQDIMEVEEEPESSDVVPEKLAEEIANAGREHQQGKLVEGAETPEDEGEKIETEGEYVLEHTVQRPPETYFHTLIEQEELTVEDQFDEDVEETRALLEASQATVLRADDDACHAWAQMTATTQPFAAQLCDQLRLILEPTEATRLKGDYKSGKRLNMRKVIAYIASHFLKDKIWLRRSQPSKRDYHILLAVDDSESMKEVKAELLAKQAICLVAQALTKLEVGNVGVVSFGSSTTVLHSLDEPFSDASGAKIFANLKFDQKESRFLELLKSSMSLFSVARGGATPHSDTAQILIIISDGQTHARSEQLRAAVREARNQRIFVVFFVLEAVEASHSFYDVRVWDSEQQTLKPLAEEFPFPYYLVIRDVTTLPFVLAEALRRWFELVSANAT